MSSSFLPSNDFRSTPNGVRPLPGLEKARVWTSTVNIPFSLLIHPSRLKMSSPNKLNERRGDNDVDSVVLSDLIAFLSGLSLNQTTADAAIQEIRAWARPSLFGTPPSSPVSFPVSPLSSHDSASPQIQTFYPTSLYTPAPLSSTHSKRSGHSREIHTKYKQAAISAHSLPAARVIPTAVPATSATAPDNSPLSAPSTSKSGSSAFTTAFSNNLKITSSTLSCFEVVPETLRPFAVVGNPELRTFVLETAKGEKRWQQVYKGVYFDVPGPDANGPFYLVTKGTRIGILAEWPRTAPYVIGVRGSCYVGVLTVEDGVRRMMNSIKLGESCLL
ncbi:hypothetical protein EV401DRAFT_1983037 [Pisolithus croceorrhizus]|nr:hypothetical protein EV401DRAFT_1983037 [Pisolithus croceorrhizus]